MVRSKHLSKCALLLTVIGSIAFLSIAARGAGRKPSAREDSSISELPLMLNSGKPTLAYVYYSVACSCTAAHCAIAEAALDSASSENRLAGKVNILKIDGFTEELADSVFKVGFVPLIVHYDKDGKETSRIEWEISKEMIENLVTDKAASKNGE